MNEYWTVSNDNSFFIENKKTNNIMILSGIKMRRNHGTQFCDCFTPTNRFKIFFEIVEYAEKIMIIVKFDDNLSTVLGAIGVEDCYLF